MITLTRKQYLADSSNLHHVYYMQFATPAMRGRVTATFSPEELAASTDRHFNDIPLSRWDDLARASYPYFPHALIVQAGDFYSLSFGVCLLKAIAGDIVSRMPTVS